MKALKLTLVIITFASIIFFVIRSFVTIEKVGEIKPTGNPFIDKIQQEIKAIQLKPDNRFCKDYYNEVVYHIEDFYKSTRLGKSASDNNQWKDNLSKHLYALYSDKFIKQVFYVFNRSEWAVSDLTFIRNECEYLHRSTMIERNGELDKKFKEIKAVLNKYDEINGFISSCYNISYNQTDLEIPFPIGDVKKRLNLANSYITNGLENSYVNNCIRLHNDLKKVPLIIFRAHISNLDSIINSNLNSYIQYNSLNSYTSDIYSKILSRIEELDSGIYKQDDSDNEYSRLKNKWEAEGTRAYEHFN